MTRPPATAHELELNINIPCYTGGPEEWEGCFFGFFSDLGKQQIWSLRPTSNQTGFRMSQSILKQGAWNSLNPNLFHSLSNHLPIPNRIRIQTSQPLDMALISWTCSRSPSHPSSPWKAGPVCWSWHILAHLGTSWHILAHRGTCTSEIVGAHGSSNMCLDCT